MDVTSTEKDKNNLEKIVFEIRNVISKMVSEFMSIQDMKIEELYRETENENR